MNETSRAAHHETLKEDSDMLREFIACYVDHPSEIKLDTEKIRGGYYFHITVHASDQGKMIGRRVEGQPAAPHLRALRIVLAEIGRPSGVIYRAALIDKEPGIKPPEPVNSQKRRNAAYDPAGARATLEKLLGYMSEGGVKVSVKEDIAEDGFLFTVAFEKPTDRARFVEPYPELPRITLLSTVQTLWVASANKVGTNFRIEVT